MNSEKLCESVMDDRRPCRCGRLVACRSPPSPSCHAAGGWCTASGAAESGGGGNKIRQIDAHDENMRSVLYCSPTAGGFCTAASSFRKCVSHVGRKLPKAGKCNGNMECLKMTFFKNNNKHDSYLLYHCTCSRQVRHKVFQDGWMTFWSSKVMHNTQ